MDPIPVIEIPSGVSVSANTQVRTDVAGLKTLYESGVSSRDCAAQFKLSETYIKRLAKDGGWLRPTDVENLRREIAARQSAILKQSGKAANVTELKAHIWNDRGERLKERTYEIIDAALQGVTMEKAAKFINNPKGLLEITTAARLITGEEKAENNQPQVAVNIGFLRSQRPTDVVVEAEEV